MVGAFRFIGLVCVLSTAVLGVAQTRPQLLLSKLQAMPDKAAREKAAADAVKTVRAAEIAPAEGLDWARVYSIARLYKLQKIAVARFQRTNPSGDAQFQASLLLLDAGIGDRDAGTSLLAIKQAKPVNNAQALKLAMDTATYNAYAIGLASPTIGLEALEAARGKVNDRELSSADLLKLNSATYSQASRLHAAAGAFAMASQESAKAAKLHPEGSDERRVFQGQATLYGLVGKPVPALLADEGSTQIDLSAHKGKVVLLDFYAHWCGPCIAAFPDLKKMASDLGPKGLQVVGVTRYYGYFGTEREISKDAERSKLGVFGETHGLTWPTVIGTRQNQTQFGVSSIPTVVLVDRDGIVRHIKVGYSKDSFAEFRAVVEKLLG